jgi:hypothetical protein
MVASSSRARRKAAARLAAAQERLKQLEQEAGIREETERIATAYRGDDAFRAVVFKVPDVTLRRQIMEACRECELAGEELQVADDDRERHREIIRRFSKQHRRSILLDSWIAAAVLVAIGHLLGTVGEIGGAALGILYGVSRMFGAEETIVRTIQEHKELLKQAEQDAEGWADSKPVFSDSEIESGQPDK